MSKEKTGFKYVGMLLAAAMLSLMCAASGYAHDTWIVMQSYTPEASQPAVLNVANAHLFEIPGAEFNTRDRIDKVYFFAPDAGNIPSSPRERQHISQMLLSKLREHTWRLLCQSTDLRQKPLKVISAAKVKKI